MRNLPMIKISLLGLLAVAYLICVGCHRQSERFKIEPDERLQAGEQGRIYEGFICLGQTWQVYVRRISDLNNPDARYWARFDPVAFRDPSIVNAMRRQAVEIDWPNTRSATRVIRVKFIGEEMDLQGFKGIAEINHQLLIKRVIDYSLVPADL